MGMAQYGIFGHVVYLSVVMGGAFWFYDGEGGFFGYN